MMLLLAFGLFLTSFAQSSGTSFGIRMETMVASVEGDMEYVCQKYYWTEDCTGEVAHTASKKYHGCNPYLFEADALGKYFHMQGRGGHCIDNTCTKCEVSAPAITADLMVGGKTPTCRSRKYLGLSEDTTPTWNFHPGPCPNMCEQFYAKHPGCAENYDGDLPCEPTQEEFDYAPQCFKLSSLATASTPNTCVPCSCSRWDGENYSNCRPVTDANPCKGYCVQCEADGVTAIPGPWTEHEKHCAAEPENKITWEHAGNGGCSGRKWRKIGIARSLEEAKEKMLSDSRCNSDQSMLFYSRSWVRCATAENHKYCKTKNKNWQKYILHTGSDSIDTEWCPNSARQFCRMMCSNPTCSEGQCALRDGTCCDYNCIENSADTALARTNERLRKANTALRSVLESLQAN